MGSVDRNTSNSGVSSHFNLCPGGWRNQCTLILQTSAWLRLEKHCLGEIRLFFLSLVMTRYSTQTHKHMYLHTWSHWKALIIIPQLRKVVANTSQIDQIVQKAEADLLSPPYLVKFICYKWKKNTVIDFPGKKIGYRGCKILFFSLVSFEQTVLMWPFQSFTNDLSALSSTHSDVWIRATDQRVFQRCDANSLQSN